MGLWARMSMIDPVYKSLSLQEQQTREKKLAFLIGLAAILLAPVVMLIDVFFEPGCLRNSISAYFYEPRSGPLFVFILAFVAAFMFRYRGENWYDGCLSLIAGIAAFFVAVVPTELGVAFCSTMATAIDLRGGVVYGLTNAQALTMDVPTYFGAIMGGDPLVTLQNPGALFSSLDWLHLGAAIVLLVILFYFTTFAFTRVRDEDRTASGQLRWQKLVRNSVYYFCSFLMLVSFASIVAHMLFGWDPKWELHPVLMGEAVALTGFGIAWMIKGRFWFGWLDSVT